MVSSDYARLVELARRGDADSRGRLLDEYRRYLGLLARLEIDRRLQGKVDPSDLVQETFLDAHRDFRLFRGATENELMAWLRQLLACNLADAVRHYNAQRRDTRLEQSLAEGLDNSSLALDRTLAVTHSSPSQRAARREQALLLADALGRLPEHYREVMILHQLEGLPLPEVARRMGRTVGSVEKLWMRGLVQLRRFLGAES